MRTVVAAIIEQDGNILICQRREGQSHALKWEFPGGKVEDGETPAQALQRELEEELSIRAVIGPELTRYEYAYPGRDGILLIFFRVGQFHGELRNLNFHRICWERPAKLPEYDFLEGDVGLVRRLSGGG